MKIIIISKLLQYRPGLADDKIQYGFRKQKSTQDTINKFCNDIKEAEGKYAIAIYIDIKRSFRQSVVACTLQLNLPNWMIQVLRNYCGDRKEYFGAPGEKLKRTPNKGCPQRSVCGTIFCDISISPCLKKLNDLEEVYSVIAYVDEMPIIVEGDS